MQSQSLKKLQQRIRYWGTAGAMFTFSNVSKYFKPRYLSLNKPNRLQLGSLLQRVGFGLSDYDKSLLIEVCNTSLCTHFPEKIAGDELTRNLNQHSGSQTTTHTVNLPRKRHLKDASTNI